MSNEFTKVTGFGIPEENYDMVFYQDTKDSFREIARLKQDGTFFVLGTEFSSLSEYIIAREGLYYECE